MIIVSNDELILAVISFANAGDAVVTEKDVLFTLAEVYDLKSNEPVPFANIPNITPNEELI